MSSQEVDFKIVDLIISTGVVTKELRHQIAFHECIHELSSLPISRLSSEPSYLRECHKRVVEENYKWAYDNYGTFIETAECTKKIFKDFEDVQTMNKSLTDKIPSFIEAGHRFIEQCRKSMNLANMNSLTLQKHNQILEILEIPQLLEACIRNNYLDEALELIAHSRKLERRHPNIGIIANVTHEVRLAAQKLLDQLFQQLGGNLQLPSCLKIVGYLRRMDCLPETILRLKFLECRDNYLTNLLRSLASSDPFFHATKYMEVTRVNLFDIATQYRAVFNDDDIYTSSNDTTGQQHHMLFSSWLVMRVDLFISCLAADINSIIENSLSFNNPGGNTQTNVQSVGSKLQSLLGQSMYFGLSLSRIGSDFRGLLMPVFYQAVMKYIDMRLLEISDSFVDCIGSYKWTVNIDDSVPVSLSASVQAARDQLLSHTLSEEIVAPAKLMNHPLLALLTNQILSVLEDIRLCCPKVLRKRICQSFSDTIVDLLKSLMKYYQEESSNFTGKEQQSFIAMITSLLCCFLPHIDICLTILFSAEDSHATRTYPSIDVTLLSEMFTDVLPATFFTVERDEDNEDLIDEQLYQDDNTVDDDKERERSDDKDGLGTTERLAEENGDKEEMKNKDEEVQGEVEEMIRAEGENEEIKDKSDEEMKNKNEEVKDKCDEIQDRYDEVTGEVEEEIRTEDEKVKEENEEKEMIDNEDEIKDKCDEIQNVVIENTNEENVADIMLKSDVAIVSESVGENDVECVGEELSAVNVVQEEMCDGVCEIERDD